MLARVASEQAKSSSVKIVSLMSVSDKVMAHLPAEVEVVALGAKSIFGLLFSVFKLAKILRGYDSVCCWMYHAHVIAALAKLVSFSRIRVIWSVRHSLDNVASESLSTRVAMRAGRLLSKVPAVVVYCAKRAMQQHVEFGYSTKANSVYIPNGYTFGPVSAKSFDSPLIYLINVGRFHSAKDYQTFIQVCGELQGHFSHLRFVAAGNGVDWQNSQLVQWIDEAGVARDKIQLLGELQNVDALYAQAHFFCLTSITEGFPNVLAEAASNGCICFSTDVGDASVIVNAADRIAPVKDVSQLVASISQYVRRPVEELEALSNAVAIDVRQRFAIEQVSKMYTELGN